MPPIHLFVPNVKTTIILILTLCVIILSTCNGCKQKTIDKLKADCGKEKIVYKEKIDTQILVLPPEYPIEQKVKLVKEIVPRIDSFIQFEKDTFDLAKLKTAYYNLLKEYNTKREYVDTSLFKNGIAITTTEINQNQLQSQKTFLDSLRQKIITRTIYQPIHKAGLYLGIDAYGNKNEFLTGAGASILYQSPRALSYEVGSYFTAQKSFNFRVSIKFPLTKK